MSAWFLLLVVWWVCLCVGFRLPLLNVSNYKDHWRQMAYNGCKLKIVREHAAHIVSTDSKACF